jgi:homoserine acetyltransferase
MAVTAKRKKAQSIILDEIKKQLILQAERWGKTGFYTPMKMEEMELDAVRRIRGDLLAEKSNIEYEMQMLASNKRELDIKVQKLGMYLKRAEKIGKKHDKNIEKILERSIGNRKNLTGAINRTIGERSTISVLISDN